MAAKAGEKIDELGRAIKNDVQTAEDNIREGFTKTGETIREEFQKTRPAVHGMGPVSRIYGRLHWDKHLMSRADEVESPALRKISIEPPSTPATARASDVLT